MLLTDEDQEQLRVEGVLRVLEKIGSNPQQVERALFDTLYDERKRLDTEKNKERAAEQRKFYNRIQSEALRANVGRQRELLRRIVETFAAEVAGHFDPRIYGLATKVVPTSVNAMLNALSPLKVVKAVSQGFSNIENRVVLGGDTELIKQAAQHGTIVMVPTHSSNLDSILLGYGLMRLGLPPFLYGAGLNLFESKLIGVFMNNLGAYKVDRRKKSWVYKNVLKTYAGCTLELGLHNLFFPGGTRSRSGMIESKLKLGLLSTALEAYVRNLQNQHAKPDIFIVPTTINYQLVLEAETLIGDYLKEVGKSRYIIEDDEFSKPRRIIDFATKLFALDSQIHLVFSQPMDLFGNTVDADGVSHDQRGRPIDRRRYVDLADGEPGFDTNRDREYVAELGRNISEAYSRDTVIDATKVLSQVMFDWLTEQSKGLDLYRLLRTGGPAESLPLNEAHERVDRLLGALRTLSADGRVRLDESVATGDATKIVDEALAHLGSYHTRPAVKRRGDRLFHIDRNLIYYYQNRLSGYELASAMRRAS